jgi:uncharacterized cupin superfamily protein
MKEARLEDSGTGLAPTENGWFVVNVRNATWLNSDDFGSGCVFDSHDAGFEQVGINISVLLPGEPNCLYHSESQQESFLVLSGECKVLVEGEERPLRQWDFVHCPAGTEHVFVGAGDGPSAVLMIGSRREDAAHYPVNEVAAKYDASVKEATDEPAEAYADWRREPRRPAPNPWPWPRTP